jgi:hypothetical protein
MFSPFQSIVSYNWRSYDRLPVVNEVLQRLLQKKWNVNIYAVYRRGWCLSWNNERKMADEGKNEVKEENESLGKKVGEKEEIR